MTPAALLVTGTVGAGKTTTADRIGDRLADVGTAYAVIDLDEIRRFGPTPADDPFGQAVELANLTALAANYLRAGTQRLVLAGVVETPAGRELVQAAVGVPLMVVRLRLALPVVRERLTGRHADDEPTRTWHLARAGVLAEILDATRVADVELDVDGLGPAEVADRVLAAIGWVATGGASVR